MNMTPTSIVAPISCTSLKFQGVEKRPTRLEKVEISFSEGEMAHITFPYDNASVVTAEVDNFDVKKSLLMWSNFN